MNDKHATRSWTPQAAGRGRLMVSQSDTDLIQSDTDLIQI